MRSSKNVLTALVLVLTMYIYSSSPLYAYIRRAAQCSIDSGRMKNVIILSDAEPDTAEEPTPTALPEPKNEADTISAPAVGSSEQALFTPDESVDGARIDAFAVTHNEEGEEQIIETTIEGGLSIKNQTGYSADIGQLLVNGPGVTLSADGPQILIIHTHSSEAYTPSGLDKYEPSDTARTEDTNFNIIRVGDELTAIFEQAGLHVIHDRGIYDYPSYTGSYTRSGQAIADWLAEYAGISVVIDVHRDALGDNGTIYKTMAEEDGVCASQVMMLIGTDESGLAHSQWRGNLSLAVYLQQAVSAVHPTLMRPIQLVPQRYNQHLAPGSMILEVGSSGNTLQEALAAVRLFGTAAAPALAALISAADASAQE